MRSTYQFYAWSASGGAGNEWAFINVDWNYDQSARKINITGISYGGDRYGNPGYWHVGSAMRMTIVWADGSETDLANSTYNFNGSDLITTANGAGFITVGSVLGVFSDANNHCPVSHTFNGNSGGFGVRFGSTRSTINAGNPQSYRDLNRTSGDNPSVTFISKPTLNCGNVYAESPGLYQLRSGISGINWGVGYSESSRKLTATVSYTFQGKSYSYEAYSSTSSSTSGSFTINASSQSEPWTKVPAGANVTVTWTASTNLGPATCSSMVFAKAPDTPTVGSMTLSNPDAYRLKSSCSGINWGDAKGTRNVYAVISGTLDGETINWTMQPGSAETTDTGASFDYDASQHHPSEPWKYVPDDESVTVTWYASVYTGYGYVTGTLSQSVYCQPSYEAFVIEEGVNDGKPVEAELMVSSSTGGAPNTQIRRITEI